MLAGMSGCGWQRTPGYVYECQQGGHRQLDADIMGAHRCSLSGMSTTFHHSVYCLSMQPDVSNHEASVHPMCLASESVQQALDGHVSTWYGSVPSASSTWHVQSAGRVGVIVHASVLVVISKTSLGGSCPTALRRSASPRRLTRYALSYAC